MDGVTPKSLLLDLLRVSPHPVPVRDLMAVGELFGFEGNATRLVRRGLVESDERGSWRLLHDAMLEYDAEGKAIWGQMLTRGRSRT